MALTYTFKLNYIKRSGSKKCYFVQLNNATYSKNACLKYIIYDLCHHQPYLLKCFVYVLNPTKF